MAADFADSELDPIVALVQSKAPKLGDIEALKEGIVAILVSPAFLLHNTDDLTPSERYAAKFSYFLSGTLPDANLRAAVVAGKLDTPAGILAELKRRLNAGQADAFLRAFPHGWLRLGDINFMAPDPDKYRFYHRKDLSEDMVEEALQFFRHIIEHNRPLPEFLSADYSFINADLAQLYGVFGVPQDSNFPNTSSLTAAAGSFSVWAPSLPPLLIASYLAYTPRRLRHGKLPRHPSLAPAPRCAD